MTYLFDTNAWLRLAERPEEISPAARLANELPGEFHDDPADRLIVATALTRNLTLVTSDRLILGYPHVRSLDTRQIPRSPSTRTAGRKKKGGL